MRLDMDCVRDVLLCVEENTGLRKCCHFIDAGLSEAAAFLGDEIDPADYQEKLCKRYENDKLIYHVHYCIDAELICMGNHSGGYCTYIADLTPTGHSFLNNVREVKLWNTVKSVASKVGANSLSAFIQISSAVITEIIKTTLLQNPIF